jgi:hypothetical protein
LLAALGIDTLAFSEQMCLHMCLCRSRQVDPPKGAGVSHDRKLKSYLAEAAFYSHHAAKAGAACAVAQPLLVDVSPPRHFFFLMSDLSEQFPEQPHSYTLQVSNE